MALTHRPTCAAGCGTCPTGQSLQSVRHALAQLEQGHVHVEQQLALLS